MNQDNKEFELSGTLGSLNDAALNNLANQTNELPENNTDQNNNLTEETVPTVNEEIEMLDLSEPIADVSVESVEAPRVASDANVSNELNSLDKDVLQPVSAQTNLDPVSPIFDIGDIGSVPPIDPTGKGEKKPSKKNKGLFIFLVIIFILAIGALVFYYLRISKGSIDNAVETKPLNAELGEELSTNIEDYANFKSISSSNCVLDTSSIDIEKAGTYEYIITCGSKEYKGKITLKDTKSPEVEVKTIVKKVNDTITPEEFISSCKESTECTYTFENAETVSNYITQAGTYDLNIIIKDKNENSNTVPAKLIVIDSDIQVYLNCVLSEQEIEGFAGNVSYIDKIGISPDTQYVGIYFKIKEFRASTEEEYNNIKNSYQNDGVISINNGEGKPIFDDTNLTITFEEILSGEAEFGNNYSAIKAHYETTKNYKCNIVNVN